MVFPLMESVPCLLSWVFSQNPSKLQDTLLPRLSALPFSQTYVAYARLASYLMRLYLKGRVTNLLFYFPLKFC